MIKTFQQLWRTVGTVSLFLAASPLLGGEPKLRLDHLTDADGLSHALVFSIVQDDRGFLWFGTRDGLDRFDGYGFENHRHDPENPDSLSENSVRKLYVDSRGKLWVGTDGGGLNLFVEAEERFQSYRHDPADPTSLSHDIVWSIIEDEAGWIWVGTEDGLNRLDRHGDTLTRYRHDPSDLKSLPGRRVMSLAADPAGRLWVGVEAGGLSRFDATTASFERFPLPSELRDAGSGTVLALAADREGLWVGTDSGFGRLDFMTESLEVLDDGRTTGAAFHLLPSRHGELWVGSYTRGLIRVDTETRAMSLFRPDVTDPSSLSSSTVFSVYEDRAGSLWIGTRLGVDVYPRSRDRFAVYRNHPRHGETIVSHLTRGLYEDHEGEIWVGTGQGLTTLDREGGGLAPFDIPSGDESFAGMGISAIHEDTRGHLWVGLWFSGVVEIDAERRQAIHHRPDPADPGSLCDGQVRAIHEDRDNRLWIGTYNGLCRFDFERRRFLRSPTTATDPEAFAYAPIWAIHEQREGTLWFGTWDGLYRRDGETGLFDLFRSDPADPTSLGNNKILSLFEDRRGQMWIGTQSGGLHRLDASGRGFVRYRKRDGLVHDTVEAISEDVQGHLWVSTSGGLSRFDPETGEFRNYTVEDGLQGNIFSSSSALVSSSGELFFGGYNGLTGFSPNHLGEISNQAPVVITRLSLFNEVVRLRRQDPSSPLERAIIETSEIVLTHRDYVFALEFAALDYVNARRMEFAYMLEGFDRDWVTTGSDRRFAQYSNLDAGAYRFRVKARGSRSAWGEEASIRVVIRPPPWKTWWAYTLYVLAAVLAVWRFVEHLKRKVGREKAINRQLIEMDRLKDERMVQLEERLTLLREREELMSALEKRNLELERFNYAISHDLKNPLLTIKTFLGAVRKELLPGGSRRLSEDLAHIDVAAEELDRLFQSLTKLLEIGRSPSPIGEVQLGEVVCEAADSLASDLDEAGIEIEITGDFPVIIGDRRRLFELFRHLLSNAIQFSGFAPKSKIEIGIRREGTRKIIFVRDNGIGIEARYLDRIFGLFDRLDPAMPGTGIGLALVKRIVEAHGGEVWAESEGPGRGSTFFLTLATLANRQSG